MREVSPLLFGVSPTLMCAGCGLTAQALHDTGRMGCAACYQTFAPMVAHAAEQLHRVQPPLTKEAISEGEMNATSSETADLPWPTRRAVVSPSSNK